MKACTMQCIKYILFFFNLILVFGGVALIVAVVVETKGRTNFAKSSLVASPTVVILLGCLVLGLASFGCCGAIHEIAWKLIVYGVLMLALFLCQVAQTTVATASQGDVEKLLKDNMRKSISENRTADAPDWDKMQSGWECCGVDGPKDYGSGVPASCCQSGTSSSCSEGNAFQTGCFPILRKIVDQIFHVVSIAGGIVALIEVIAAVASFCLVSAIRSEEKERTPPPPQAYAPPPQGYAPPPQGYAPPPQGYAPPPQGYAPPPQGYAPPPQGYAPPPSAPSPPKA